MEPTAHETRHDAVFHAAYDKVLAKWPADTEQSAVSTPFGTTCVTSCGPQDGPPLILLPSGRTPSVSWYANAADLSRTHRVHALDLLGEPGRSVPDPRHPLRTVADLTSWLDALLDGLELDSTALAGHSYGGWIALHHALHAPTRITRLALLDPTLCFTGYQVGYLLRAVPMMLRPTPRRIRTFLEWESGAATPDAEWLRLQEATAGFPTTKPVTGPRPSATALRSLHIPVLLLVAAGSRAHDSRQVAARAAESLPRVETAVLPGVSHHALPHTNPAATNRHLLEFLSD